MTHLSQRQPKPVEQALLAVMAAHEGDCVKAQRSISQAQQQARATARRDRQVIEIAALVVAGQHERAAGLAMEHSAEYPGDADLLTRVAPTAAVRPGPGVRSQPAGRRLTESLRDVSACGSAAITTDPHAET